MVFTASPMIANSRSTAERIVRLARYDSTSTPLRITTTESHASTMSRRWAITLRGIQHLLRRLDIRKDVRILDGADHHEIDRTAEQVT